MSCTNRSTNSNKDIYKSSIKKFFTLLAWVEFKSSMSWTRFLARYVSTSSYQLRPVIHVCTFNKILEICVLVLEFIVFYFGRILEYPSKQTKITTNHAYPKETIIVCPQLGNKICTQMIDDISNLCLYFSQYFIQEIQSCVNIYSILLSFECEWLSVISSINE